MTILSFEKPKQLRTTKEHAKMFSSDSGVAGTYVPNMSDEDKNRWKALHINAGKDDARIEIRCSKFGAELLIIVALDGWNYKSETKNDKWKPTKGKNIRISTNGPLHLTFEQFAEMQGAINEAYNVLSGETNAN